MAQKLPTLGSASNYQDQIVPEDGPIEYSNVYIPSNSDSCSSLDESDHNHNVEGKMTYPQDLLGVSWGSYLYSGPPTARGRNDQGSQILNSFQSKDVCTDATNANLKDNIVAMDQVGNSTLHGILRVPQVNETPAQLKQTSHQAKTVKLLCEETHEHVDSQLLHSKLQGLVKCLSDCKNELERCGFESVPLANSLLVTLKVKESASSNFKNSKDTDNNKLAMVSESDKVLHDVIEYLRRTAEQQVKQGKKLNEQALFLQKAGRQLVRNHQNLLEEQAMLELATERDREQLEKEKQELEIQTEQLELAGEQLQALLRDQRRFGRSNRMSSPHTIAQGRSQLVALKRTQKEQSRLEKIFLQQQREIRKLQQEQEITRSDLIATKEHAERLQHKLEEQIKKMRKSTLLMTSYTYDNRESHGPSKQKEKQNMSLLFANQRTLVHEVERMRQWLADQQKRERQLQHQQDSRQQQLKETGTKLKWQAAAVRGGYDYQEFRKPKQGREKQGSLGSTYTSPYKLPTNGNTKKKCPKKSRSRQPKEDSKYATLPSLTYPTQLQSGRVDLLHHPLATTKDKAKTVIRKKSTSIQKFTFSKTELESLACFKDEAVAKQVLEWLEMQGRLSDT